MLTMIAIMMIVIVMKITVVVNQDSLTVMVD